MTPLEVEGRVPVVAGRVGITSRDGLLVERVRNDPDPKLELELLPREPKLEPRLLLPRLDDPKDPLREELLLEPREAPALEPREPRCPKASVAVGPAVQNAANRATATPARRRLERGRDRFMVAIREGRARGRSVGRGEALLRFGWEAPCRARVEKKGGGELVPVRLRAK